MATKCRETGCPRWTRGGWCAEHRRAGDARTEEQRRRRVMHGWAFRDLPADEVAAIERYLAGGPVPPGYEHVDETVR